MSAEKRTDPDAIPGRESNLPTCQSLSKIFRSMRRLSRLADLAFNEQAADAGLTPLPTGEGGAAAAWGSASSRLADDANQYVPGETLRSPAAVGGGELLMSPVRRRRFCGGHVRRACAQETFALLGLVVVDVVEDVAADDRF